MEKTLQALVTEAFESARNIKKSDVSKEFSRHYIAGLNYNKKGDFAQSIGEYRKALQIFNDESSLRGMIESFKGVLSGLGNDEDKAKTISKIFALYEQDIASWPTAANYSNYMRFLRYLNSKYEIDTLEKAVTIGEECLKHCNDSKEMYALMSNIYRTLKDDVSAHIYMIKACELSMDNLHYLHYNFNGYLFDAMPGSKDGNTVPINIIWNNYQKQEEDLNFLEGMLIICQDNHKRGNEDNRMHMLRVLFEKKHNTEAMIKNYLPKEIEISTKYKNELKKILYSLKQGVRKNAAYNRMARKIPVKGYEIETPKLEERLLTPSEIRSELSKYVVGQEHAQKVISIGLYKHSLKLRNPELNFKKQNILLMGPTGVGKTYLASRMAKILDVPFVIVDCSLMTESGYVGEDATDALKNLYYQAQGEGKNPEQGIIYFDEIDKIAVAQMETGRDVHGRGAQQPLLKMIEGHKYAIPKNKYMPDDAIEIDTTSILCVAGGSFLGDHGKKSIYDIAKARVGKKGIIGFGSANAKDNCETLIPNDKDMINFGLLPELIGRFPIRSCLDDLTVEQLAEILVKPEDSLFKQEQEYFRQQGTRLEVTDEAIKLIAAESKKSNMGARGLNSIMSELLLDFEFNNPDSPLGELMINENYVKEKLKL